MFARPVRLPLPARAVLAAAAAALFPVAVGCSAFGGVGCGAGIFPALDVSVEDARTGQPAAAGAQVTVRDGGYTETLAPGSFRIAEGEGGEETLISFSGATERAGTYTVRVEKPGYRPWEQTGVRVRRGECGVQTVRLVARLEPEAP